MGMRAKFVASSEMVQSTLTNQGHAHEEIYPIAKRQRRSVADPDRQALCQPEVLVNLVLELQLSHRMHRVGHHGRKLGRIMMSSSFALLVRAREMRGEWEMVAGVLIGETMIHRPFDSHASTSLRMTTSIGLYVGRGGSVEGWSGEEEEEEKRRGWRS
jgi:hypothetical protein